MKISKSKLEQIIREELSHYLSNIYKWCPDGQKCPPGSEKTKWWKGPSVSKGLDEEIADVLEAHQMPIAGFSYRGAPYKRDDDEEEDLEEEKEKRGDKWVVTDEEGSETLGTHSSEAAADRQLRAIHASQAEKKKS